MTERCIKELDTKGFFGAVKNQGGNEDDRAVQADKATEIVCLRSDLWERELRDTRHLNPTSLSAVPR